MSQFARAGRTTFVRVAFATVIILAMSFASSGGSSIYPTSAHNLSLYSMDTSMVSTGTQRGRSRVRRASRERPRSVQRNNRQVLRSQVRFSAPSYPAKGPLSRLSRTTTYRSGLSALAIRRIQNVTQEHKCSDAYVGFGSLHGATDVLVGSYIEQGTTTSTRVGNKIRLTGLRLKGTVRFNYDGSGSGDPAPTALYILQRPVYLNIYLCEARQSGSPLGYWYKSKTDQDTLSAYADTTADSTGDLSRYQYRMNTDDFRVLGRKQYAVYPPNGSTPLSKCLQYVDAYWKLDHIVQYHTTSDDETPYSDAKCDSKLWLILTHSQPDPMANDAVLSIATDIAHYQYFME